MHFVQGVIASRGSYASQGVMLRRELCALHRELSFAGSYASQEFLP